MRAIVVLGALLLSGCGTTLSLEELENQALLTGDWSAVEARERAIARREARRGIQCPAGRVSVCESFVGSTRCQCVTQDGVRRMMAFGLGRY